MQLIHIFQELPNSRHQYNVGYTEAIIDVDCLEEKWRTSVDYPSLAVMNSLYESLIFHSNLHADNDTTQLLFSPYSILSPSTARIEKENPHPSDPGNPSKRSNAGGTSVRQWMARTILSSGIQVCGPSQMDIAYRLLSDPRNTANWLCYREHAIGSSKFGEMWWKLKSAFGDVYRIELPTFSMLSILHHNFSIKGN